MGYWREMVHPRLAFHTWPAAVYAIGDVHGCLDQLLELERVVAADALNFDGETWLVTVGDHIDRGPRSKDVIEHVMEPAPGGHRRFALMGNHEAKQLDFFENPAAHAYYLDEGGSETLASYGIDLDAPLRSQSGALQALGAFPEEHRRFIAELPLYLSLPGWLFVHAGIRPGIPLAMQTDDDLIWIRAPFLTSQLTGGLRVVHGHPAGRRRWAPQAASCPRSATPCSAGRARGRSPPPRAAGSRAAGSSAQP